MSDIQALERKGGRGAAGASPTPRGVAWAPALSARFPNLAVGLPLPFSLVSVVDHWFQAGARFWGQMVELRDPTQVLNAEEALGLELVRDGVRAWIDLYATPMRLLTEVMMAPPYDGARADG